MAKRRTAKPDGATTQARDCDGAFDALRGVLIAVVDGKSAQDDVRRAVRDLCISAHAENMKAEELLVRFKTLWASLPQLSGLPRGRQQNDVMARVASMCIEEFYGGAPASSAPAPRDAASSGS